MNQATAQNQASDDILYAQAVGAVRSSLKPSTSYVQRMLQIGYNKATMLIERMEREGIVTAADATGKRQVIMENAQAASDAMIQGAIDKATSDAPLDNTGGVSGERLRSFIQRIEKLEEDKAAVGEDLKEVFAEAKGTGFDVKIIRQIVRLRKQEVEQRRENAELLDLYCAAIGME